jgi:hypothetical protein
MAGKGRTIEKWKHPDFGIEVPIRLTGEGEFVAEFNNIDYSASTLSEIRQHLVAAVETTVKLSWQPILQVSSKSRERTDRLHQFTERILGGIEMDARRFWIAEKPDGNWLMCWVWYSENAGSPFPFPVDPNQSRPIDRLQNAQPWNPPVRPFALPCVKEHKSYTDPRGTRDIYLSYKPELWDALVAIAVKMEDLAIRLEQIFQADDVLAELTAAPQRLALPK